MSDFVRGGQIILHKIRMVWQVVKRLIKISVLIWMGIIAMHYIKFTDSSDWHIAKKWLYKDIVKNIDANRKIEYIDDWGYERIQDIQTFENSSYVKSKINRFESLFHQGSRKGLIWSIVIMFCITGYMWMQGRSFKAQKELRGIFLITAKRLKKILRNHNSSVDYQPFEIAGFPYPVDGNKSSFTAGEQGHTLIIGSTGSGKTTTIMNLVKQLDERNEKAIIVDVKGDYIEKFYKAERGDVILNPLDERSRNWSFLYETDELKGFSTIAKSLLPKTSKSDPIWTDSARIVLAQLATLFHTEGISLCAFANKILNADLKVISRYLKKTPAGKAVNMDIEKAALSVLMTLTVYIRPLKLYKSIENAFSITEWIKDDEQKGFLFIGSNTEVKEDLNPLVSAQVDIAVNTLTALKKKSKTPKIWFIMDEVAYFEQEIPNLKSGLTLSRSYGGCFVLGVQDISGLRKIYDRDTTETITNNCKTKVCMNVEGKENAEWISQTMGEGEVMEYQEGLSYGAHEMRDGIQMNQRQVIKRAVLASEAMNLRTGHGFIKFAGFSPSKFKEGFRYLPKRTEGYVENEQLRSLLIDEIEDGIEQRLRIERELEEEGKYTNIVKSNEKAEPTEDSSNKGNNEDGDEPTDNKESKSGNAGTKSSADKSTSPNSVEIEEIF